MYERYFPTEGWYHIESEPEECSREQTNDSESFLGSILRQFGLGGNSPEPSVPIFRGIPILDRLDSGDILLLLLLYYLYQESKDEEWLIILVLVVLLG